MASCCERGMCLMKHVIMDDGADFGFMYTSNNTIPNSKTNFLALDVPDDEELLTEVTSFLMQMLAHYAVKPGLHHGENAVGNTTAFVLKKITDPGKLIHIHSWYMTRTEPSTIFELVPLFPYKDPKDWGKLPLIYPGANKDLQMAALQILNKWKEGIRDYYLSFFGPTPVPISIEAGLIVAEKRGTAAFINGIGKGNDWKVGLNPAECALVVSNPKYFQQMAEVYLRKPKRCAHCDVLYEQKMKNFFTCSACKMQHYCCKEHQKADWKKHKPICKQVSSVG